VRGYFHVFVLCRCFEVLPAGRGSLALSDATLRFIDDRRLATGRLTEDIGHYQVVGVKCIAGYRDRASASHSLVVLPDAVFPAQPSL